MAAKILIVTVLATAIQGIIVDNPDTSLRRLSGEITNQPEIRFDNGVNGQYLTQDSDGTRHNTDYSYNIHNGLNAVVGRGPMQTELPSDGAHSIPVPPGYITPISHGQPNHYAISTSYRYAAPNNYRQAPPQAHRYVSGRGYYPPIRSHVKGNGYTTSFSQGYIAPINRGYTSSRPQGYPTNVPSNRPHAIPFSYGPYGPHGGNRRYNVRLH